MANKNMAVSDRFRLTSQLAVLQEVEQSIKENQDAAISYYKKESELQKEFDKKYEQCESVNNLRLENEIKANNNLLNKMESAKQDILDVAKELDDKFIRHTKEIDKLKEIADRLYINV